MVVLAAVASGCSTHSKSGSPSANQHAVVLRMESALGDTQPLDQYARAVAELSHGSVKIQVGIDAHRGDPRAEHEIFADVKSGRAPLGWVGSRVLDTLGDRRFQALTAPLLIDSYALEQRVLASSIVAPMLASMRELGVVGLGVLPGPMRRVLSISSDLTTPAAFRGKLISYSDSQLARDSLEALGARPRPVGPMAGLTGDDGSEAQLGAIYGNQYYRGASSVTGNLALWPRPLVPFMNARAFGELTNSQRTALRDAAARVVPGFTRFARSNDREGLDAMCNAGTRFTSAKLGEFRKAFAPIYARLRREPGIGNDIARIEAMRARTPPDPAPRCQPGSISASTVPAVLDGVYRKTLTPAQAHSKVDENYGTFVRVFDHGRFALTQESRNACTWDVGTYVVHRRNIHFVVGDAGGIAPNNAGGKPGETVDLQWNLYHGALTLPSPPGQDPVEFGAYRKLTPTPTSRYFSRRCPPPKGWDS
jgi:TRAP-type C4-dicarboxylate transport system substrate-binding protein